MAITSRESTGQGSRATTVAGELAAANRIWWRLYLQVLVLTLVFVAFARQWAPHPAPATLAVYLALVAAILIRPPVGIYAVTFLTLVGDSVVASWYPFAKNFSSRESISYVSDALTITPLDLVLGVTVVAWLLRSFATNTWRFRRGVLGWPMMIFGTLVVVALGRAIVGGADNRVAIFEGRAMLYVVILYLLIVQLFETRRQYVILFVVALLAILIQSLIALQYFSELDVGVRSDLERLTEHSASVHLAALFLVMFATWVIPGCSAGLRTLVVVAAVPGVFVFGLSQRRSAAVALGVGVVLLFLVLWRIRPRILLWLLPVTVLLAAAYLLAFWNSTGSIGFGAQAFKSVFAADQLDQLDRDSDIYRQLEAFDVWYTIRASPLFGVGFGAPFLKPWPLPYLPGFEFRDFVPHNNFLWIWLKLGVAGFTTMLFLIGRAIQNGARNVVRLARGDEAALMMGAVGYVVMYMVFIYVDIGWDARSMVFLAVALAWCADFVGARADEPAAVPVRSGSVGRRQERRPATSTRRSTSADTLRSAS